MKSSPTPVLAAALIILQSCATPTKSVSPPPLVDGNPEEYSRLDVEPIRIADSVDLYFYQDDHFVWICYTYPTGSYGTLDMQIQTDQLKESLNIHVSAQIGEWPVDQPDLAPDNPLS